MREKNEFRHTRDKNEFFVSHSLLASSFLISSAMTLFQEKLQICILTIRKWYFRLQETRITLHLVMDQSGILIIKIFQFLELIKINSCGISWITYEIMR